MWGTDGVRVFTVDDGWAGSSPPSSIGTPSVSAGMSASAATASPPCSRSPWGLRAVWLDRGRRGSGAGLADGSRLPVSVGPLHQPGSSSGASSRPTPSSPSPDQRRRRAVQSHAEGNRSSMVASTATSRSCGRRRDFELYNAQWIVEKNGYLSPASSSSGVARRDLNQARRVRQTCVQGTGCATEIYSSKLCGFCYSAKRLLKSKQVDFTEIDVMFHPSRRDEMISRAGGRTSVPQILSRITCWWLR